MPEQIGLAAVFEDSAFQRGIQNYMSGLDQANAKTSSIAGRMGKGFDSLGGKVLKAGALMGGALVAGAGAAGGALAAVGVQGSRMAADLEQQVSGIVAVLDTDLRATGTSTADAIAMLNDQILELGIDPALKVNATEAADAIQMLARNGLSMSEIMEGAARNTVLLANATDADFGVAADIATDVMALFNIEAANMGEAVNGITSVVNNSKFSIDDYRLALAQGGGVAASVGVEFDDFNATIAAISPLFASGSDAGTSFKTFLQRLIPTTTPAKDAMRELGLLTEDGANAFFHASGEMKSMAEITGILNSAFAGLTEEQKSQYAATIFGTDAMRAAFGVAGLTKDEFLELKGVMGQTDAEQAAATRMDNLRGVMEILSGVIDTLKIQIGQALIPVWRSLGETMTELATTHGPQLVALFERIADWLAERLPGMIERVATGFAVLGFVIGEFMRGMTQGSTVLKSVLAGIEEVMDNVLSESQLQTLYAINDGILAFADSVGTVLGSALQFVRDHMDGFMGALAGIAAVLAASAMVATITSLAGAIAALVSPIGMVVAAAALLGAAWTQNWGGIQEKTAAVWATVQPTLQTIGNWLQTTIPVALTRLQTAWDTAMQRIQMATRIVESVLAGNPFAMVKAINEFGEFGRIAVQSLTAVTTAWALAWPVMQTVATTAWAAIQTTLTSVQTWLQTNIPTALTALQTAWSFVWSSLQTTFDVVWGALQTSFAEIQTSFTTLATSIQGLWTTAQPALGSLATMLGVTLNAAALLFSNVFSGVMAALPSIVTVFVDQTTAMLTSIIDRLTTIITGVRAAIDGDWATVWSSARQIVSDAVTSVTGTIARFASLTGIMFNVLWTAIANTLTSLGVDVTAFETKMTAVWTAIQTTVETVVAGLTTAWARIQAWLAVMLPVALAFFQNVWTSVWSGTQTAVSDWGTNLSAVLDAARSAWQSLIAFFTPTINRLKESFAEMVAGFGELGPQVQAMWEAAKPALTALAAALGVGLVVAVNVFVNAFSAVMRSLPDIVGPVIDQVTAIFELLETVFTEIVAGVKAVIDGDWDRAWESVQTIVAAAVTYVQGSITRFGLVLTAIFTGLGTFVTSVLSDLGVDLEALGDTFETTWQAIDQAVSNAWDVVRPIFNALRIWFATTIPFVLGTLQAAFEKVWPLIKAAVEVEWKVIKAALSALDKFLGTTLPNAVETLQTKFEEVWPKIQTAATSALAPINSAIDAIATGVAAAQTAIGDFATWIRGISIPNPFANIQAPSLPGWAQDALGRRAGRAGGPLAAVAESLRDLAELPDHTSALSNLAGQMSGLASSFAGMIPEGGNPFRIHRQAELQKRIDMLTKQNELLDLIEQHDLDPAIVGSLNFGRDVDPAALLDAANVISAQLTGQLAQSVRDRAETMALRQRIDRDIAHFEKQRSEFAAEAVGLAGVAGPFADLFEKNVLGRLASQIEGLGVNIDDALARFRRTGSGDDLWAAFRLEADRVELIEQYRKEQEKVLAVQRKQQETAFLQSQVDLLRRAQELGLDSFSWDVNWGMGASPRDLLAVVNAITDRENQQALFDLQNARIFQGLVGDLSFSGIGSGLVETFQSRVLDPLWERMHDITLSEAERVRLAEQYRAEQEKVLRIQEAQARLDFVQQQLDLLKVVQDNELNAGAIFGGLTLGVNASIDDLLAAVERVVTAMTQKMESELQIASPSRVMARISQMAMAGLTKGIEDNLRGPVTAAMRAGQGVAAGVSQTIRSANVNMGGVNIHNGMDDALFTARIEQVVRRAM